MTWTVFETCLLRLNTILGALFSLARWQQVAVINALRFSCSTFATTACSQITPNLAANQLNVATPAGTRTSVWTVCEAWTFTFAEIFFRLTLLQTDAITITVNCTVKCLVIARFDTLVDVLGMLKQAVKVRLGASDITEVIAINLRTFGIAGARTTSCTSRVTWALAMAAYLCLHVLIVTSIFAVAGAACVVTVLAWLVTCGHAAGLFFTPNLKTLVHFTWWLLAKI